MSWWEGGFTDTSLEDVNKEKSVSIQAKVCVRVLIWYLFVEQPPLQSPEEIIRLMIDPAIQGFERCELILSSADSSKSDSLSLLSYVIEQFPWLAARDHARMETDVQKLLVRATQRRRY